MPPVDRFTVSLDTELLAAFDAHLAQRGYENRSEAIRDLIRDLLLEPRLADRDALAVAVVTVVCDHEVSSAYDRLRTALLECPDAVLGALTRPLDARRDMMAIMLRGTTKQVQQTADRIQAIRGLSFCHSAVIPTDTVAPPTTN